MICEREQEIKVINYANKNNYTMLANTFGTLQYVKYNYKNGNYPMFLKWSKGSSTITITENKKETKFKLSELK